MLYFAYGSNMSLARLQARTPSARPLGPCRLAGHRLCFHKVGHDGSAKCDAWHSGRQDDVVWGVLFRLDPAEKAVLDRIEGLGAGYEAKQVAPVDAGGRARPAYTYYATDIEAGLSPFDWYLHHVVRGAREAGLPGDYLAALECTGCIVDPDPARAEREFALHQTRGVS